MYSYAVEFNKTISVLVNCDSVTLIIGNLIQSKMELFYLSPYVNKNRVAIQQTINVFAKAKKDINRRKSIEEVSGARKITVQYWMTQTLNKRNKIMEIHDK